MKGSRVETIEAAWNEYKKLLKEGWNHTSIFKVTFKDKSLISNALRNNLEGYIHYNSRTWIFLQQNDGNYHN